MPQSITDGALTWQRLAVVHKHPRDDRIQFEEESHTYTIDGVTKGWVSCTKFFHAFFGHFDSDAVIAKMMTSPRWYESKYYGMTADEIKKKWSDKGKNSSEAGTRMHLDIEHFYNALPVAWVNEVVNEVANGVANEVANGVANGVANDAKPVDVETGCKAMVEADAWHAAEGPEWNYFLSYQSEHGHNFLPFRTEWLVFDIEHKVSGSIDMVYKKPDGKLAIYDWKRIEEVKTENNWQHGLGPVSHLPDTNYWHYSLQLNVYRWILQRNYGYTVDELALVVLHPGNKTWRVVRLNIMDDEVEGMMAARKRALEIPGNDGSAPVVVFDE